MEVMPESVGMKAGRPLKTTGIGWGPDGDPGCFCLMGPEILTVE